MNILIMMKTKVTIFLLVFFSFQSLFAQKQTNFWYFGMMAGMDFTSGSPVALTNGNIITNEGTAVMSDSLGNLLFYTDGVQVWNKNNGQMPNGFGLAGDYSTTQIMIVPHPGNANLYYIFTLDDEGGPDGFNYSVVDMSMQSGNGDVTLKNNFLQSTMTEKLAAVYHCNGHDIWLMAHDLATNDFIAYLVTDAGVSSVPVISSTGIMHNDVHGQMKFNSNGTKIACAIGYQDTVQVFDFDNQTGIVSMPLSLALFNVVYGLEFSPDNSKLYGTYYNVGGVSTLYQFDLAAANIQTSLIALHNEFDPILYGLQLGPDNKVYVTKEITPYVGAINSPNVAGVGCNYMDNAVFLDPLGMGTMCMLGLPGFIQSYFNPDFANGCIFSAGFISSDTLVCAGDCISFTDMTSCSPALWQWTFTGGNPSSSTDQNPIDICYSSPGNYYVSLIVSDGCLSDTIVKMITVVSPVLNAGPDVTISPGESVTLNATGTVVTYSWIPTTGLSDPDIANPVATPESTTTYIVTGIDANNCIAVDSVIVTIFSQEPCVDIAIPNAFSPNNDGVNDHFGIFGNCIQTIHLSIYSRWGEKVFETTDSGASWDGKYKGRPMPVSVFIYYLEATLITGETISKKGNVTLVR